MDEWTEDSEDRLNHLIDQQERRIAAIFRKAIAELRSELDLDELAALLRDGRVDEALARLEYAAQQLGQASNVAFVTSGQSAAEWMQTAGLGRIVFDQVNLYAVAAMQRNTLQMVREFTAEQRRAVHTAMTAGVTEAANPIAQARNFRDSVGLTERQWKAVENYRRALQTLGEPGSASDALSRELRDRRSDAVVARAAASGSPLSPARIDAMVRRYSERFVAYRAKVIGRTEAMRAVNQGNEEAYRQAIAAGTIRASQLEREWRTRIDTRERESHRLLNTEKRGWGEDWVTITGARLSYPGDPDAPAREVIQCRCALLTRIRRD